MANDLATKFKNANFFKRFVSAVVVIPIPVILIYIGGFWYNIMIYIMGALVAFEWLKITYKSEAVIATAKYKWYVLCAVYVGLAIFASIFLRNHSALDHMFSYKLVLWICIIVWTTDIAAYCVGVVVGGPKIWPRVSPSKTWSGLAGAIIFSIIAHEVALATVTSALFNVEKSRYILWVVVALTSTVSQIGDFLESAFKRYFKVKDSGNLIPGHGGIMDRVDGLLMVVITWFIVFNISYIMQNGK